MIAFVLMTLPATILTVVGLPYLLWVSRKPATRGKWIERF